MVSSIFMWTILSMSTCMKDSLKLPSCSQTRSSSWAIMISPFFLSFSFWVKTIQSCGGSIVHATIIIPIFVFVITRGVGQVIIATVFLIIFIPAFLEFGKINIFIIFRDRIILLLLLLCHQQSTCCPVMRPQGLRGVHMAGNRGK
eukprot:15362674-Ditylum_brightwellii.AAC.1